MPRSVVSILPLFALFSCTGPPTSDPEDTDTIDTDDTDDTDALTETDCDNGADDDMDGLVDCEDADCFSSSCTETCDDQLDNDDDGLTDCWDDDCWSVDCHPHGVRAWVTNGQIQQGYNGRMQYSYESCNGDYADMECVAGNITANNVQGRVQVLTPSAAGWSGATTSCGWSVGRAYAYTFYCDGTYNGQTQVYASISPVVRSSINIDTTCRLPTPIFLPGRLRVGLGAARFEAPWLTDSILWYSGKPTINTAYTYTSGSTDPCPSGDSEFSYFFYSNNSWSVDTLLQGEVVTFTTP